jgi:DNA modification methylase
MKSHISLSNVRKTSLPAQFQGDDVRYSEEFVEYFLSVFTKSGDVVFDPFMGFGTTLIMCETMGRVGYGVEYDPKRCAYVQSMLKHPERALLGDSTKLDQLQFPDFDFSITSPPYMGKHHTENPFTAYSTEGGGYAQYLKDIQSVYAQMKTRMKPGARAVVEVANLKHEDGTITTLAWDIGAALSEVLRFQGEIIVNWDDYGYGYQHSYCLVFSK